MGVMIDGVWHDRWYDTAKTGGRFEREASRFRDRLATEPGGEGLPAEPGRYHLYVSLACPWAHRTLIWRRLKRLEGAISVSVVDPRMGGAGWTFGAPAEAGDEAVPFAGATGDALFGNRALHEVYARANPDYSGRVTVPVLWDKLRGTIVNNESAEIVRMFDRAFDHLAPKHGNPGLILCPDELRDEIDAVNADVYDRINNGVYKAGFATTQAAYEAAVVPLFEALDRMEARLADGQGWLVGGRMTEADLRLFTTLVRFDPVYHGHFKCNLRRIADYPMLTALTARLLAVPAIRETVDDAHIRWHYYWSHTTINPTRVVPLGPAEPPRLDPSWPAPALD
ncbi:glutathione S-transferase family protein [Tistrella mobilis]|uniref:Glutathione S-transferase n=1 Tax=Tistrella mobilis (strain KA081020-065) TaxID=1110502 RepID=I3TQ20_TISMK|nr:glutathione S-transferase family protein [Tistrella mobilis]AFK54858.1 putative glutathione S-transferase [Tistrella mobilis KA081020-065]